MRWRVCYVDGSAFTNEDGAPEDAPGSGVLAVAQEDDALGLVLHHQTDFYIFSEHVGGWYGVDVFGFVQYLMRPGLKIVKLGESMTTDRYLALIRDLQRDPGLPDKSARYPWEANL